MKKHIEKRFLFEKKLTAEELKVFENQSDTFLVEDFSSIKKMPKDKVGYLVTEANEVIQAFPFKDGQGNLIFIPEPDPVLIYFHTAYLNYRLIHDKKKEIFKILSNVKMTEPVINQLYEYYGLTSSFIILLFTAVEAFINRSIPYNFIYSKPDKRKTETYTKEQIERYLPFNEKRVDILPIVAKKDFAKAHPNINIHIDNLKDFRDGVVHTKTSNDGHTPYDYLYKRAFKFEYEKTLNAVASFMNFYSSNPDYIKECPCSNNW